MAVPLPLANPFWDWALDAWRRPGVETQCLALQDDWGVFVPTLLFAFWCTGQGLLLLPDDTRACGMDGWQNRVLDPLRQARREAQQQLGGDHPLYRSLRHLELRVERLIMASLYVRSTTSSAGRDSGAESLLQANLESAGGLLPPAARKHITALAQVLEIER